MWAATDTADKVLGWKAKLGVKEMCEDQWKWASTYPKVGRTFCRDPLACHWCVHIICIEEDRRLSPTTRTFNARRVLKHNRLPDALMCLHS